jgi:transcriptional regulator with XRE-family HTH domain
MAKKASPKAVLREYRQANKLTADQVGRKIGVAGSTWRSFENGHREVDGDTAVLIEKKLGIDRAEVRADLFERRAAA